MEETNERLSELESRLTHQDALLQELSRQVYDQDREIERLRATVRSLVTRMKDLHPGNADLPDNERPPHY